MTVKLDRCWWNATSSGAVDFVYASTVAGALSPVDAGAMDGEKFSYIAEVRNASNEPTEWELGLGTWTEGTVTLARTPSKSSNGGAAVVFTSAPNVRLGCDLSADFLPTFVGSEGDTGEHIHITAGRGLVDRGGDIILTTGEGTSDGGTFYLISGQGDDGGSMHIFGGEALTGDGGEVEILGGRGPISGGSFVMGGGQGLAGPGGSVGVYGGDGLTDGGRVSFESGSGNTGNGGNITFETANGEVDGGNISFTLGTGNSGSNGKLIINGIPTVDPMDGESFWLDGLVLTRAT